MSHTVQSAAIDPGAPWRLSHILAGHTSDVKSLARLDGGQSATIEQIQSASRDEQTRTWRRDVPSHRLGNGQPATWSRGATLQGKRYQNSVAMLDSLPDEHDAMTMIGGLDSQIRVFRLSLDGSDTAINEPIQILSDHHDNVCHLSVSSRSQTPACSSPLLISASWDFTSRVWSLRSDAKARALWKPLHVLKGHERAVWAAEVVSAKAGEERYLTASADLFVRYWHGQEVKRVFAGHTDVVRGIALLPAKDQPSARIHSETHISELAQVQDDHSKAEFFDNEELFTTCSNDGTLRVWSLDDRRTLPHNPTSGGDALRVLIPLDDNGKPLLDLIYDVCSAGFDAQGNDRLVLSCGEGGMVAIWNVESGSQIASVPQPVMSTWDVAHLPASGDIATAGSDAQVRVYTQRSPTTQTSTQQGQDVNQISECDGKALAEHDTKCDQVAAARRSRMQAEIVAREGERVAVPAQGTMFKGQRYDAVLQIDVSDDAEPLCLPMNKGDHPRAIAHVFIAEHSLPKRYEDDIVAFIEQVGPK